MSERDTTPPVSPGDVLAEKYRVERVLGAGGMGVVVEATHLELDERVALKFLLPAALENPEAATRFVREARAAVRIKSEHVVRVSDVGRLADGAPYIVMEFLEGTDLSKVIDDQVLPVADAVDYVLQACLAMTEAHGLGIVHRDLKPSNLFLTRRSDGSPVVKVLDFGISKVVARDKPDPALTKTATPMGSPYYMSPEQLRSARDVDHRTDIWALGVILFEMFTQMPPFQAESMPQLVAAVLAEPPMSIDKLRPDLPAELRAVITRCFEKDPARRFQSVAELGHALLPFAPPRSRYIGERLSQPGSALASGTQADAVGPTIPAPKDSQGAATVAVPMKRGEDSRSGTNAAWAESQASKGGSSAKLVVGGVVLVAAAAAVVVVTRGTGGSAPSVATGPSVAPQQPISAPATRPEVAASVEAPVVTPTPPPVVEPVPAVAPVASTSASARPSPAVAPPAKATMPRSAKSATPAPAARPAAPVPTTTAPAPVPAPTPATKPVVKNPLSVDIK